MPYENLSICTSIEKIIFDNKKLANRACVLEKRSVEEVAVLVKEIEKIKGIWEIEKGELSRQYGEQIAELASRVSHLEKIIDWKSRDNRILKTNIDKIIDDHATEIAHLILQLENYNRKLQAVQHEESALKERVDDLLSSNSWRITFPLRLVSTGIKRIFAAFRVNC